MNLNNIKTTIFKELRGIIRDKKSIQKLIFYPLLIPFVIILFGFLLESFDESKYIVGINYELTNEEKNIIDEIGNITVKEYKNKTELENAYEESIINGYIIKDDSKYTIYADDSQNSGQIIFSLTNTYLELYNKLLGNKYLTENGIDSDKVFNTIQIESKSLSKEETNILTNTVISLIIAYITMIVIMVSIVVVTDATSGEKERGTLETILTFPVRSSELVIGKYIASSLLSFIVGLVSYLLTLPSFYISKSVLSFHTYEEIMINTSPLSIVLSILLILLSSLLSSGVCMALCGKAKTYKEAQSSLQFLSMLPMIPYFLKFLEINNTIFDLIPIANCSSLLNDVVTNSVNYQSLLIIILSTIIYIVVIIMYISKQYKKEEILFS